MNSKFNLNVSLSSYLKQIIKITIMSLVVAVGISASFAPVARAATNDSLRNWWPVEGAVVSGVQPFKASVDNQDISSYTMYWQVDNGQMVVMPDSWNGSPHKEVAVDVSGWSWRGKGPYVITFTAKDRSGATLATKNFQISLESSGSTVAPTPPVIPVPVPTTPTTTTTVTVPVTPPAPVTVVTTPPTPTGPLTIQTWWPTDGAVVQGTQPFKAVILNKDIQSYSLYWKIGNGSLVPFANSYVGAPHKETLIDFTNWTWLGRGPYVIDLVAQSGGQTIATSKVSIYNGAVGGTSVTPPAPISTTTTTTVTPPVPVTTVAGNPLSSASFYVDPNSNAASQVTAWQTSRPQDALTIKKIANSAQARWFGNWNSNIGQDVASYVQSAQRAGAIPLLVLYNIPQRDCGSYSAGGANDASAYAAWIQSVHQAIGNSKAAIILEPDALAQLDCLSAADQNTRVTLLQNAISTLKSGSGTIVYVDAGNPFWQSVSTMTDRLNRVHIQQADGFSVNVSNYITTSDNLTYGDTLSRALGNKHFVVDTSRNGAGPDLSKQWCNPSGRAIGPQSTTVTHDPLADAFLWIKNPGESDGNCNGGPNAGVWWADYALGLAQRAAY